MQRFTSIASAILAASATPLAATRLAATPLAAMPLIVIPLLAAPSIADAQGQPPAGQPGIADSTAASIPGAGAGNAAAVKAPPSLRPVEVHERRDGNDFNAGYNTSITKLPADLKDVPQSVTVVNQALMQSQGATSLADALRNVPGITIGGAEGGQIGNNINLNGFSARTDIFYDGLRDRGQYYRDVFALDSVEVLMGPSSMLFGRGSTGGAINQVSKVPSLRSFATYGASVTTNGLLRTTADYDQPLSATSAFRIAAMAQDGRPSTRDEMTLKDIGLAPSLRLGIGTPTVITLSGLLQRNHDMPDYGLPALNGSPVKVDRNTFYGFTTDRTDQNIGALNADVLHRLTPTMNLRNRTQYNYVHTDAFETAPNAVGVPGGTNGFTTMTSSSLPLTQLFVRQQSHDRVIRDYSVYNQTELSDRLQTGEVRHDWLVGAELGYDNYRNQASYRPGSCDGVALNPAGSTSGFVNCEPLVDPADVASPGNGGNVPSVQGNLANGTGRAAALYANDTMSFGRQFKLVTGLRYDRFAATVRNAINSSNTAGSTALARADQTVHFTSVRLGGIWQPTPAQSYYVSYGTSFDPSLEQLTATTGTQGLDPEKNKSYEAGGKWDLYGDRLSLNAAAFQITQDNTRTQVSPGVYVLEGNIRVRGLRFGATGRITPRWQVFGGYTWLDGEVLQALDGTQGKVPANTPRHTLTLWSTYALTPGVEVGGGAYYMSQRYVVPNNSVSVPGYVRWDATAAWRQPHYDIRLNVFNVFDKMYFDQLIQSDGGRSVPGIGRTAMLSFTYRM